MLYNFICTYCGMSVSPRSKNSAYAYSKRIKGRQTLSYVHLSCVEAAMPKNKKEVFHNEE